MSQTTLRLDDAAARHTEAQALLDRVKAMEAASDALATGARRDLDDLKALRLRAEAALNRDAARLR